jgi:hypothetical protein
MDPELLNKVTWKIPNALALGRIGRRRGVERHRGPVASISDTGMKYGRVKRGGH